MKLDPEVFSNHFYSNFDLIFM